MYKCVFTLLLLINVSLHGLLVESSALLRTDGSELNTYFTKPEQDSFPIVLAVQGSECESVLPLHKQFAPLVTNIGAGIISLEKQGILPNNKIIQQEYDQTNCSSHRIQDHLILVQQLRNGLIPGWNGQLILVGGSEGGAVASAIAARCPETVASVFYSTGGGMGVREQLRLATRRYFEKKRAPNFVIKAGLAMADAQLDEIMANPTHKKMFLGYTYKWWHDYALQLEMIMSDMLSLSSPIFYVHGTDDELIPIESADRLAAEFERQGKTNLKYVRLPGYPHDLRRPPIDIFSETANWLSNILY